MRLSKITNYAYGATVALTLASSAAMLISSNAIQTEREKVSSRYQIDKRIDQLELKAFEWYDLALRYSVTGDPALRVAYETRSSPTDELKGDLPAITSAGVTSQELARLNDALESLENLKTEVDSAMAIAREGTKLEAEKILFSSQFQSELNRAESELKVIRDRLDLRIEKDLNRASVAASFWKTIAEVVLGLTALIFLSVLFFVFRQRVLRPVLKMSDVIVRLAAEDFEAELPEVKQIDEIGDMAQAVHVFRENGLARQRLEIERDLDRNVRDMLSRMTQRMQGCETIEELQKVVVWFAPEIVPGWAGRIYLLDKGRKAVVEICKWGDPKYSESAFASNSCWALRRGVAHRLNSASSDIPCAHLGTIDDVLPSTECLPLVAQSEIFGMLYLEPAGGGEPDSRSNEVYKGLLAENIGLALANFQLRDALRVLASVDPLTGLANRRELERILVEQFDRAAHKDESISCLMVDVDHFKHFNDRYGHDAGDTVLREVGRVLANSLRKSDFAFRYGGEEFTVLLPNCSETVAVKRAEDICQSIRQLELRHGESTLDPISVSIGVACASDATGFSGLLKAADMALFQAKELGRDRVEFWGSGEISADDSDCKIAERPPQSGSS